MTLHIFKCSTQATRSGLTPDKTGGNLPAKECDGGTWIYSETIDVNVGDPPRIGAASAEDILSSIGRDGYYINNMTILFNEKTL